MSEAALARAPILWGRAFACTILHFLVIGSYYVAKSVRESVLTHDFHPSTYPKFMLAVCVITLPVGAGIAAIARHWPRQVLVPALYVACAAVFAGIYLAYEAYGATSFLCGGYYIWASVYNLMTICLLWAFINDLFSKDEGRRVFGTIGAGGLAGGLAGSYTAGELAERIGSIELLPIAAGGLLLCAALFVVTHVFATRRTGPEPDLQEGTVSIRRLGHVFADPYVALIAALVVLHTFSETTVYLQSNSILNAEALTRDQRTAYFGKTFLLMSVLGILTQFVLTTPVHRRWGPRPGLFVLPVATLLLAPLLLWRAPARQVTLPYLGTIPLQVAILAVVGVPLMAFAYSIKKASTELLYLPTNPSVKYQAKPVIDMFGFRLGDTLTALLAMIPAGGVARVGWFAAVGYVGCLVWMALAWRVGGMWHVRRAATPPAAGTPAGPGSR